MTRYLARRLAFALFLVFAVSSASLVLARLAPGDYVIESLGTQANRETIERERARFGLNKPFAAQYRDWLAAAVRFDFGRSLHTTGRSADLDPGARRQHRDPRAHRAALATLVGLPLGIVTGSRPPRRPDRLRSARRRWSCCRCRRC